MDNRGNYRDSDRDGANSRRGNNDRGGDRDRDPSSSSSSQQRRTDEEETTYYRSQIAPRPTNITTHRVVPASNNIVMEHFYSYGIGAGVPLKPGGKSAAVVAIQENREREKRELSHLNDRFASYIERVRYLEAQNKKLQLELEHLRGKWGTQTTKVKDMYDVEIREARRIIDDTAKDRASAELRAKRAEEETLKFKDKYDVLLAGRDSDRQKIGALQKQLADNEADLNLFRRRLADLEDEQKRYRAESQKLSLDIQRVTQDLDQETIARVQLENEKQSLEEEINFLKQIHAQEIEELKHANLIGTALDPANFFKHELSNAIRDIREEYEQLNNQQRNELESWYRLKVTQAVQEIQARRAIEAPENVREREEIKKLRVLVTDSRKDIAAIRQRNGELENRVHELEELVQIERREGIQATNERDREIQELRNRLEELGRDYEELVTTKSSLDAEIAIYRKLLEGEENRGGLKQVVANVEEQARAEFAAAGGVTGGGSGGGAGVSASGGGGGGGGGTSSFSYSRSYRTASGGQDRHITPSTSTSNDNIRYPSTIREESIRSGGGSALNRLRDQGESSDRSGGRGGTEGDDSSLEDPNERRDRSPTSRKDEGYGKLRCGFRFDRARSKLIVRVFEARDLINTDKNSLSDPYVRLLLLPDKRKKTKRRTKIMKDTLAPVFDETFEYDMTYEEAKLKTIDLTVKNDRSLFSTEKVFMGQALITLANYNLDDGNLIDHWFTLEPEGALALRLKALDA
jgi:intermediate filament protein if